MNFVEELRWRGMIHDMTPGTEEYLAKGMATAYVGIDPTADSLHIGHLVSVMILKHFQRCGHKPVALVGGATGMIGDPSGKSLERNLLDETTLRHNQEAIKGQLARLLDFGSEAPNAAALVNNYDWMKGMTFLDFIRDTGKLITVNYMMAKDSVKKRFDGEGEGMSFTEFTYQLVQGYDFLHLFEAMDCRLQLGGSDQWGNITTGTELIRRKAGGEAYALTCPLIKKADGTKFGKTEQGNIWLSAEYTSPYRFYQFWLNTSDEDAKSYIRIFTMLGRDEIDALIAEQEAAPHLRPLQKRLAEEVTMMIHSRGEYEKAVEASQILFGGAAAETLRTLDEATLLDVLDSVPTYTIRTEDLINGPNGNKPQLYQQFTDENTDGNTKIKNQVKIIQREYDNVTIKGINKTKESVVGQNISKQTFTSIIIENNNKNIVDVLVDKAKIFSSKSELRKLIANGGISLNNEKVDDPTRTISTDDLIAGKYLLVRKGKKNYYLIVAE